MQVAKLNELDYSVLAILLDKELSGYDITQYLKHFRNTSHSRVYPGLAKLESLGYVVYRDVSQIGKPDKKLYKLTAEGIEILRTWLVDETKMKMPKVKDEEVVRMLCLHLLDKESLLKQLERRRVQVGTYSKKVIAALAQNSDENIPEVKSHALNYLHDALHIFTDCDALLLDWLISNIKDGFTPKQSLREYLKENL